MADSVLGVRLLTDGLDLASRNDHKIKEFRRMLEPLGIEVRPAPHDFEAEETAPDFRGNAFIKAQALHRLTGRPALADDSGLVVDTLGGEPGVLSARYGGAGLSDAYRTALVLDKMRNVPDERRTARFVCVLALVGAAPDALYFEGVAEGLLARSVRGQNGFGYDPIFIDPASNQTFAELSAGEKDRRSHRSRALQSLLAAL